MVFKGYMIGNQELAAPTMNPRIPFLSTGFDMYQQSVIFACFPFSRFLNGSFLLVLHVLLFLSDSILWKLTQITYLSDFWGAKQ